MLWDTLLISITGWSGADEEVLSRQCGCDYHLLKPLDPFLLEVLLNGDRGRTTLEEQNT